MRLIFNIKKLKQKLKKAKQGIIFCFGTSLISRIIQYKTRDEFAELVPSHVALYVNGFIYESTTEAVRVNGKIINGGVRRWQAEDFFKSENKKDTRYYYHEIPEGELDYFQLENNVHRPYGKDTILEYMLKKEAQGDSKGLICSQYANLCTNLIDKPCVTPADLYRRLYHNTYGGDYDLE